MDKVIKLTRYYNDREIIQNNKIIKCISAEGVPILEVGQVHNFMVEENFVNKRIKKIERIKNGKCYLVTIFS